MIDRAGDSIGGAQSEGRLRHGRRELELLDDPGIVELMVDPCTDDFVRSIGFEVLMARHGRILERLARHYAGQLPGDASSRAEELAQDVALKLWRMLDDRKTIQSIPAWIRKVTYTTFIDQINELKGVREMQIVSAQACDGDSAATRFGATLEEIERCGERSVPEAEETVRAEELNRHIAEALDRFARSSEDAPRKLRAVAHLRGDAMTQCDTARVMGVAEITIRRWEGEFDQDMRRSLVSLGVCISTKKGKRGRAKSRREEDVP